MKRNEILTALKSGDPDVMISAAKAAQETGDETLLPEIREALESGQFPGSVRYHVRKAYNQILEACKRRIEADETLETGPEIPLKTSLDALSLDHPDPTRRMAALRSAAALGNPAIVPHLVAMLQNEVNPQVIATCLKTLGRLGNYPEVSGVLKPYLGSEDERIRANCVEAYEFLGDPGCVRDLAPLLKDRDNRVKANTVKALWNFGQHDVMTHLVEMLESGDEWSRDSAIHALGYIRSQKSRILLRKALSDPSETIRSAASQALVRLEAEERAAHASSSGVGIMESLSGLALILAVVAVTAYLVIDSLYTGQAREGRQTSGTPTIARPPTPPAADLPDPERALFHFTNAAFHFERGDMVKAAEECGAAISLDDGQAKYHLLMGRIDERVGDNQGAVKRFRKAMSLDSAMIEAREALGRVLVEIKSFGEALPILETISRERPNVSTLSSLGLCEASLGMTMEASNHLMKALKMAPGNPQVENAMGVLAGKTGNLEKAIEHFKKAVEADPTRVNTHMNLAMSLVESGRLMEAAPILKRIILMAPRTWDAREAMDALGKIGSGDGSFRK